MGAMNFFDMEQCLKIWENNGLEITELTESGWVLKIFVSSMLPKAYYFLVTGLI